MPQHQPSLGIDFSSHRCPALQMGVDAHEVAGLSDLTSLLNIDTVWISTKIAKCITVAVGSFKPLACRHGEVWKFVCSHKAS